MLSWDFLERNLLAWRRYSPAYDRCVDKVHRGGFLPVASMVSMHRVVAAALCLGVYIGAAAAAGPDGAVLISGIDLQNADDSVRIQDDFYRHVNGRWLATTQIPADRSAYDSWFQLGDDSLAQLRGIVEALLQAADHPDAKRPDPDQQKIADLYASFMDEAALEQLGLTPLAAEFARVEALSSKQQIASLIAHYNRIGVACPVLAERASGCAGIRPGMCSTCARTG